MTEYTKLIELVVNDITRVITIPNNNIVLGVVGDIEVNKLMFKMPRYYCGFDMSEFTPKINYVTPNAEGNYYKSELEVTDDVITFTWLLTSDVTEHNGTVKFSISLYKKENGRVSKVFNSRSSVGNVLEGLNVDAYVTPEQQQTILDRLETEIREDIQSFVTEKEASINQQITEKSDAAIKAIDAKKNDVLSAISEDQYIQKIEQNAANVGSLREDLVDVKGVFPQKVNNNYCKNEVEQYGSTLYQPVFLEKGYIYKVAHIGSTEIGGATISIVGYLDSIVYTTLITTNYFYPNGGLARQNFAWDNDSGWYRLKFNISAVFTDAQKETYKTGWIVAKIDDINSAEAITEFVPYGIGIDYTKVKLAEKLVAKEQDIACIGDSLTYGYGATVGSTDYPSVLQTFVTYKTVYNLGVPGEATDEILARQGGYPAVVSPFTIPADTTAVEITFADTVNIGSNNTPLLRKNSGNIVNPVIIDGVEGSILLSDGKYCFSRTKAGTEHEVKRPQYVVTKEMREHKDDIQIIFVGTNGGWMITDDDAETRIKKLTSQIDMMIDYNTSKKYIIIGMHYYYPWVLHNGLTKEQLENAMLLKYGNHYINLRKYMIEYGLADAGLTATETDTEAINNGNVPPSLLYSDGIHGNAYFYNILANLVNKNGIELGYWN